MAVLDDLSGFEFEDLMEDVFRNLGYENVRQAKRTADEGRDVLMEEVVVGERRAIIVECKHTDTVGRPVVQKLHSAIATFGDDDDIARAVKIEDIEYNTDLTRLSNVSDADLEKQRTYHEAWHHRRNEYRHQLHNVGLANTSQDENRDLF